MNLTTLSIRTKSSQKTTPIQQLKSSAKKTKIANQLLLKVGLIDYIAFLKMMKIVYINKNNIILSLVRWETFQKMKIREDIITMLRGPFILTQSIYSYTHVYICLSITFSYKCLAILKILPIFQSTRNFKNVYQRNLVFSLF